MESHEVLKKAINTAGVKAISSDLGLSASLIYKWCEAKETRGACGADNPLDRLLNIYAATGDVGPIAWLCEQAQGFFVHNPEQDAQGHLAVFQATQQILKEFSDVLRAVSESNANDDRIDPDEARQIRAEWEELKAVTESFVVACERGVYGSPE